MAEDSAKETSKEKLKFFKTANGSTEDPAATEGEAKESQEQAPPAPAEEEPKAEKPSTGNEEVPVEAQAEAEVQTQKTPIMPMVAPTVALAVRILVILAIIVADAYAAYFLVVKGIAPRMAEAHVVRAAREASAGPEIAEAEVGKDGEMSENGVGSITPIEDIVVNPAGSGGTRYLCTTVALESLQQVVADEVAEREPQIRDALIEILSRRTVEDLSALGTRDELRKEIKIAVNDLLASGEVVGVYLSNFVLQ